MSRFRSSRWGLCNERRAQQVTAGENHEKTKPTNQQTKRKKMKSETRELSKPTLPQRWLLGRRRPQRQRPVLIFFCRFRLGRHFAIGGTVLRMGPTHQFLIFFLVRCCFLFHRSVYCVCVSTFLRPPPSSSVLVLFLCLVFFFIGRAFSSNFSLALNPPLIFSPRATVLLLFF